MGDYVLVGVHTDEVLTAHKRKPILTMEQRVASLAGCRWVDEVIPNTPWKFDPTWIEKYDIGLVVHGSDYSQKQIDYYYKVPLELGIFRTIPYSAGISTTDIIRRCKEATTDKVFNDETEIVSGIGDSSR